MPITCDCGTILKDEKGLKKHKRLYCKLNKENKPEPTLPCPNCEMLFFNLQCLNQHRRQVHKAEYNEELEKQAEGARKPWSQFEVRLLAEKEVELRRRTPDCPVNATLALQFNRTIYAIKGRRKQEDYKKLIAELESRPNDNSINPSDLVEASTSSAPDPIILSRPVIRTEIAGQLAAADPTALSCPGRITRSRARQIAIQATGSASVLPTNNFEPEVNSDIVKQYLECLLLDPKYAIYNEIINNIVSEQNVELLFSKLLSMIPRDQQKTRKTKKKSTQKKKSGSGKTSHIYNARAYKYKLYQELYKKDRRALANCIINNSTPGKSEESPGIMEVESEYKEIFGKPSPEDNEPTVPVKYNYEDIYKPVTPVEISEQLNNMKPSAPGPDGVSLVDLKKISLEWFIVLFNGILFTGITPKELKDCRTTLIPKKGDLKNIKNWRPITISSVILRFLNKIIASRLSKISINLSQKGFRRVDGCMANTIIVHNIIKEHREKIRPYNILTLDLKKAFDSVSFESIPRAMERVGIHNKIVKLVKNQYEGCSTFISCAGNNTGQITIKRGVKQGDPLSPILFNLILDELLCSIDHSNGLQIGDSKIAALAYADDLILLGPDQLRTQHTLNAVVKFLERRGLSLNPEKCLALSSDRVPKKKKLFVVTSSRFNIGNTAISQLKPNEYFKYLGRNFDYAGISKLTTADAKILLDNLHKSPLKPSQKLNMLVCYILPRFLSDLQYPAITAQTLKDFDRKVRACVRRFVHIPASTHISFYHARTKDGGLGIPCFQFIIPVILRNRLAKLAHYEDSVSRAALNCNQGQRLLQRLSSMIGNIMSSEDIKIKFRNELELSYSGNGLYQGNTSSISSNWVYRPPNYWTGRDYVRAIKLKANMLPTHGIPSNPPELRKCRACCRKETLSHVLQGCPATHWERINRHNTIANHAKSAAVKAGYEVFTEPHIRMTNGELKIPDLVCVKQNTILISDIGIHWEGLTPLAVQYERKKDKYSTPDFIRSVRRKYGDKTITVAPVIVGARGVWCSQNKTFCSLTNTDKKLQEIMVLDTMKGSWKIHADFYRRTWRRIRNRTRRA